MEWTMDSFDRVGGGLVSLTLVSVGLGFIILGLSLFPVIGVFLGLAFIYIAFSPQLRRPVRKTVQMVFGMDRERLRDASIVPVVILSTSREKGEEIDFDASTVKESTVTFGPDGLAPIGPGDDPAVAGSHLEDVDGDGDRDYVFYFRVGGEGLRSRDGQVCIRGETVDGRLIEGCTKL